MNNDTDVGSRSVCVDCDAAPTRPSGWNLVKHTRLGAAVLLKRNGDRLLFDGKTVTLVSLVELWERRKITGDDLDRFLSGRTALNDCVHKALLANPDLIPDALFSGLIDPSRDVPHLFFPGTRYLSPYKTEMLSFLFKEPGGVWKDGHITINEKWLGVGSDRDLVPFALIVI